MSESESNTNMDDSDVFVAPSIEESYRDSNQALSSRREHDVNKQLQYTDREQFQETNHPEDDDQNENYGYGGPARKSMTII